MAPNRAQVSHAQTNWRSCRDKTSTLSTSHKDPSPPSLPLPSPPLPSLPFPPLPSPPLPHYIAKPTCNSLLVNTHCLLTGHTASQSLPPWKISRLHIIHPVAMVTYIYPPNLSSIDALARNSTTNSTALLRMQAWPHSASWVCTIC